jgi:hypothetical protein
LKIVINSNFKFEKLRISLSIGMIGKPILKPVQ